MPSPTAISVVVDLPEYSKFEIAEGRSMVMASVTLSGGGDMSTETVTVELIKARRLRDEVVSTATLTIVGTSDPVTETVLFDLPNIVDSDLINLVRRGYYFIRATSDSAPAVSGISADFPISIVTAKQLRDTYLFGIDLESESLRTIKFPPINITGVEVIEVSSRHETGFDVLSFTTGTPPAVRQLSWGKGGPLVSITSPGTYLLRRDCSSTDYMLVRIRSLSALPTTGKKDELLVVKSSISDAMLQRFLTQAVDWWENDKVAGVYLEPTYLVTDPVDVGGVIKPYDVISPPVTFYPVIPARWIDILFPFQALLRVDQLFGQIANTRIIDVALEWLEIKEKNGFGQLVPFNQTVAFQFIGLVWVESLRGRIELPNFWHYDAVAGLREVDPIILEILAKKAAVDALTIAGQAFRGGFASQSISRDGVSESVSYTASAIYGIYSATIEDYNKFINKEIKQLRGRYRGPNMVVL